MLPTIVPLLPKPQLVSLTPLSRINRPLDGVEEPLHMISHPDPASQSIPQLRLDDSGEPVEPPRDEEMAELVSLVHLAQFCPRIRAVPSREVITSPAKEDFLTEKESFRDSQTRLKADAIFRQRLSELRKEVKFSPVSS